MDFLTGAPWWVYLVFVVGLYLTWGTVKDREVNIRKMYYTSLVSILLSLIYQLIFLGYHLSLCFWLVGFFVVFLVVINIPFSPPVATSSVNAFRVKGTWWFVICFLSYFSLRYYIGYRHALGLNETWHIDNNHLISLLSGAIIAAYTTMGIALYRRSRTTLRYQD